MRTYQEELERKANLAILSGKYFLDFHLPNWGDKVTIEKVEEYQREYLQTHDNHLQFYMALGFIVCDLLEKSSKLPRYNDHFLDADGKTWFSLWHFKHDKGWYSWDKDHPYYENCLANGWRSVLGEKNAAGV